MNTRRSRDEHRETEKGGGRRERERERFREIGVDMGMKSKLELDTPTTRPKVASGRRKSSMDRHLKKCRNLHDTEWKLSAAQRTQKVAQSVVLSVLASQPETGGTGKEAEKPSVTWRGTAVAPNKNLARKPDIMGWRLDAATARLRKAEEATPEEQEQIRDESKHGRNKLVHWWAGHMARADTDTDSSKAF